MKTITIQINSLIKSTSFDLNQPHLHNQVYGAAILKFAQTYNIPAMNQPEQAIAIKAF